MEHPPPTITERDFPADTKQVAEIRAFVTAAVAGSPAADDLELVVSELAANAIIHGSRPGDSITVSVTVSADGEMIRVDVTDAGRSGELPRLHDFDDVHTSGRGMAIVSSLADDWGYARMPGELTTWARFGELAPA